MELVMKFKKDYSNTGSMNFVNESCHVRPPRLSCACRLSTSHQRILTAYLHSIGRYPLALGVLLSVM